MEKSNKNKSQIILQVENPTMETRPLTGAGRTVSELLKDSGNCRQIKSQELHLGVLRDSLFSEQQKLSHVLDWAHRFLSRGSEVHHQPCRADSLTSADEERWGTQTQVPAYMHPPAAKYHQTISCAAGGNGVFGHFPDDPRIPFSFIEDYKETAEYVKSMELQEASNELIVSQDNRTSSPFFSNRGPHANVSDRKTNQPLAADGVTCLIKESTSRRSNEEDMVFGTARNLELIYQSAGAQSERDISGQQMELGNLKVEGREEAKDARKGERKGKINEEQEPSSGLAIYATDNMINFEPERTKELMEKTCGCHLKMPPRLSVYERYQCCVDTLRHLRVRQSQKIIPGCSVESPATERKTSVDTATQRPEIRKHLKKAGSERVRATDVTKKRSSGVMKKKQDRSQNNRSRVTLAEHGQTKHRNNLTVKETSAAVCAEKRSVCDINTPVEHLGTVAKVSAVEDCAALTTRPGTDYHLGKQTCIVIKFVVLEPIEILRMQLLCAF